MNSDPHIFQTADYVFIPSSAKVFTGRVMRHDKDTDRCIVMVKENNEQYYIDVPASECYLLNRINMTEQDLVRDTDRYDYINKNPQRDI